MIEYVMFLLIVIAIYFMIWAFIAGEFADCALNKGYDRRKYWHMVFWFGPVGIVLVLTLPDLKARGNQQRMEEKMDVLIDLMRVNGVSQTAGSGGTSATDAIELPEL